MVIERLRDAPSYVKLLSRDNASRYEGLSLHERVLSFWYKKLNSSFEDRLLFNFLKSCIKVSMKKNYVYWPSSDEADCG